MKSLHERTNDALQKSGGLYDFEDIIAAIEEGRMQSFYHNDTWAVTQIANFPRKIVLEIVLVVGNLEDVPELEKQLVVFGREHSCELAMATGRVGWEDHMAIGWRKTSSIFVKDL